MIVVIDIFARLISVLLGAVSLAMIVRMFVPFFTDAMSSRFYAFLLCITEPFIIPVRFLMAKFDILQNSMFDWSFTVAYIIISMLRFTLPVL